MTIVDWLANEQPRERLLAHGASSLSDAELLAIFLRTGVKGKSAVDLARELLKEFASLRKLLNADVKSFCNGKGLGKAKYVQLQACLEMARRYLYESINREGPLSSPVDAKDFLLMRMRDYDSEVFACLFLDTKNCVIAFEELFRGSLHSAEVHPREVIKKALKHNAHALIFAHNHPSGNAYPNQSDIKLTLMLRDALTVMDIKVLDHLIIGETVQSLTQLGHL